MANSFVFCRCLKNTKADRSFGRRFPQVTIQRGCPPRHPLSSNILAPPAQQHHCQERRGRVGHDSVRGLRRQDAELSANHEGLELYGAAVPTAAGDPGGYVEISRGAAPRVAAGTEKENCVTKRARRPAPVPPAAWRTPLQPRDAGSRPDEAGSRKLVSCGVGRARDPGSWLENRRSRP